MASSNFGSNQEGYFTQNQYTTATWKKMEAAGAVFLPTAGARVEKISVLNASSPLHGGQVLQYWTSTRNDGSTAYRFRAENGDAANSYRVHTDADQRCTGCAVRLAKEVQ